MTFPDIDDNETPMQLVSLPKRFFLERMSDPSGVSGPGIVASGVRFPDGTTVIRWAVGGMPKSTVVWDSAEDALAIHGHNGATAFRWVD